MKTTDTCDKSGDQTWSDLTHDVLSLVMLQLGVIDFVSFSGVCKSWRSLALSKRKKFMASTPPMYLRISSAKKKECYCYLEDFEGRTFKTLIPHSTKRDCVGLTCGYLILFGRETKDFWLVNPITRHQHHFPNFPFSSSACEFKAIIIFSLSRSDWMFVVVNRSSRKIWFSIAGKGTWNNVLSKNPIGDILVFKGKIYTLNVDYHRSDMGHLCEMRFDPWPKLELVKTRNFPKTYKIYIVPEFLSYGESLYVYQYASPNWCKVHELDVGEMKWVFPDKTKKEYEFFISFMDHVVAVKQELWRPDTSKNRQRRFIKADMWYFPHECLNVIFID